MGTFAKIGIVGALLLFFPMHWLEINPQKKLCVIIPSYNNEQVYQKNISSLFLQKYGDQPYTNWILHYTDDCSIDGTYDGVMSMIKECGLETRCKLIRNTQRQGSLANQYAMIHQCPDDAVVIMYDGDDWFTHDHVLETIHTIYQDPDIWLTYGSYREFPSGNKGQSAVAVPAQIIAMHAFREWYWVYGHLRTFYAWLFKKIKKEDLLYEGKFFPMAGDVAFMFPLLEMASSHIRFVADELYFYNMQSPINDFKKDINQLLFYDRQIIRKRPKYQPLGQHRKDSR